MQVSRNSRKGQSSSVREQLLADALQLIATGSGDEKVRWIAARDPDWFVDHVLSIDYTDRDAVAPQNGRMDRQLLDQTIARIALSSRLTPPAAAPVNNLASAA